MLYSLIPPILIVLSLVGIIVFLAKKSSKLNELKLENRQTVEERMAELGFFKRQILKIKNIKWNGVKRFFLFILEKITRFFRSLFLKLGSIFSNWSNSLKKGEPKEAEITEIRDGEDLFNKIRTYNSREEIKGKFNNEIEEIEKEIRPILKDEIVSPEIRKPQVIIEKEGLEEALIERIAANPKDVEAYERLGEYYLEIKSHEDAKECFKQVIKLDPSNRNARYKMRRLETLLSR